jgi:hypothetical protein
VFLDDFSPPCSYCTPSIHSRCSPTRWRCSLCSNYAMKLFQPGCKLTKSHRSIVKKVWLSSNECEEHEFEASQHCYNSHHRRGLHFDSTHS